MRLFTCCILLLLPSFLFAQRPVYGGKLKPEQANVDILHYHIALTLDIPGQGIDANTSIDLTIKEPATALLFDLMDSVKVQKVWVKGKEAAS